MPLTREQLIQQQASLRVFQAKADDAFQPWGMRAPAATIDESPDDYRRKLMILAKKQLPADHEYRDITVKRLPAETLDQFEELFYKACREAATRPDSVPPGQLRRVEEIDANGHKMVKWVGQQSFVHDFTIPARRVLGFRTDQGFMNTSGRFLR